MKKKWIRDLIKRGLKTKTWKIMRLSALFLFVFVSNLLASSGYAQQTKLTLKMNDVKVIDVLDEIENSSEFYFLFNQKLVDVERKVNVNAEEKTIEKILNEVFDGTNVRHQVSDRLIILTTEKSDLSNELVVQQQKSVSGKVIDSSGLPLPGVTVVIKGTTHGTVTNSNGEYTLTETKDDAVLQFSFVGMKSQEISAIGKNIINVTMTDEAIGIEEVVAIGYGQIRRRDLTGSVAKITQSETLASQYSSVDAILQGRAAGVQVNSNMGNPGQGVSVRIRGTNSLNGNNEPLYVVDGLIVNSAGEDVLKSTRDANEYQTGQNGLTGINPRDIESIEILKDASATAIYGSRGANGVVLITTKQGEKSGRSKINVYGSTSLSYISKQLDVMDAVTYAQYRNELLALNGEDPMYLVENNNVYALDLETGEVGKLYEPIDWQDEVYKTAFGQNMGVTISGANEKTNYYFSSGYNDQKGIVDNSRLQSGDLRLNLKQKLTSKLSLDTKVGINYQSLDFAQSGSVSGGLRSFTMQVLRYRPLLTDDESVDVENELSNPYGYLSDFDDLSQELRVNAVTSLEYELIKGLKYKFLIGLDYRNKERSRWYGLKTYKGNQENGDLGISGLRRYSYTMNHLLNFNKKINQNHYINTTLGFTYDANSAKYSSLEVSNFPVKTLRTDSPQSAQTILSPMAYTFIDESIESVLLKNVN